ncbi:MAG: PKD domain-containing protein, partial [Bacteroidota bacterium]
ILLVALDTTLLPTDHPLLQQYLADVLQEGWQSKLVLVSRNDEVTEVKNRIRSRYLEDPSRTEALVLIGRVPVPYSGQIFPDGHNDHQGAWPADTYYADMDGVWTDGSVDNSSASNERNRNVPKDGKFDQSSIPFDNAGDADRYAELQVGRLDFANLTAFSESELELLERYFAKNHAFRTKAFTPSYRGLIENNFANFQEGFGQNGLRNFATMFGPDSVFYRDYDRLKTESYLWTYACGGGSHNGAGGISNANSLARDSIQSVFTMHFGSYFGDWDNQNRNYLRSALASGTVLTNAWAARPNWPMYFMAMGLPIGYAAKMAMNNPNNIHDAGFGNRQIHIALMGDPTLRMYVTPAPQQLLISESERAVELQWTPPSEAVAGYHVFARPSSLDTFTRLTELPLTTPQFAYPCRPLGEDTEFMVRAIQLTTTASGSFYNWSPGLRGQWTVTEDHFSEAAFSFLTNGERVDFTNESVNAETYAWDFGNGNTSMEENPSNQYGSGGIYPVQLVAGNQCGTDSTEQLVEVFVTSTGEVIGERNIRLVPNPATDYLSVEGWTAADRVQLWDGQGRQLRELQVANGVSSVADYPAGMYWVRVLDARDQIIFQGPLLLQP